MVLPIEPHGVIFRAHDATIRTHRKIVGTHGLIIGTREVTIGTHGVTMKSMVYNMTHEIKTMGLYRIPRVFNWNSMSYPLNSHGIFS